MAVPPDGVDEGGDPGLREALLEVREALAHELRIRRDRARAERHLGVGAELTRLGLRSAQPSLVVLALLDEIDAEEPGPDERQEPRRTGRPEEVGDCVGDGHGVGPRFRAVRRETEPVDGVGRHPEHPRAGGGTGEKSGREARMVPGQAGGDVGGQEHGDAQDAGEEHLGQAVALQSANKLRSHVVARREEEHQEEHRFHARRDRDVELPDEHSRQQHRGHIPETELPQLQRPHAQPDPERGEDGDLRILSERLGAQSTRLPVRRR